MESHYYFFHLNFSKKSSNKHKLCYLTTKFEGQTKSFIIRGNKRPAYRLGLAVAYNHVEWNKIKASDFGIKSSFKDMELPVYIQSHAVSRLHERLDPLMPAEYHLYSFLSLLKPKIIKYKGATLIEYRIDTYKLGYFLAEYIDGAILLKTFLLMTNDGTPEGDKLHEQTGISIPGKKYFDIDKLKTFTNSDLKDDKKLKELFIKVGCQSLFDVKKNVIGRDLDITTAESLSKYLRLSD